MKFRINTAYYSEPFDKMLRFISKSDTSCTFRDIHTDVTISIPNLELDNWEFEPYELTWPEVYSLWKHKNGNIYIVRGHSNVANERNDEYPQTVEYANFHTGECFSRKLVDWYRSMTSIRIDDF